MVLGPQGGDHTGSGEAGGGLITHRGRLARGRELGGGCGPVESGLGACCTPRCGGPCCEWLVAARPSQLSSATSGPATSFIAASDPTETMAAAGGSSLPVLPLALEHVPSPPGHGRQPRSPPLALATLPRLPRPCSVHPLPSSKAPFPKYNQLTTSFSSPCLLSPPSSLDQQVLKFLSLLPRATGLTSLSFPWRHPASPSKQPSPRSPPQLTNALPSQASPPRPASTPCPFPSAYSTGSSFLSQTALGCLWFTGPAPFPLSPRPEGGPCFPRPSVGHS